MSRATSKTASAAASAAAAMTTPAQLERLGEHLRKLRLLKSGERLEAMLQHVFDRYGAKAALGDREDRIVRRDEHQ